MRPVDKGDKSKEYNCYNDARDDLTKRIGFYCSYCEMSLYNRPDTHNTFMAFVYDYYSPISTNPMLESGERKLAEKTIDLLKLERQPGSGLRPEHRDIRWKSRLDAWDIAKDSLEDWKKEMTDTIAKCIVRTAKATGHFSVWMTVFKEYREIKLGLIEAFIGTSKECFDDCGNTVNFYRVNNQ